MYFKCSKSFIIPMIDNNGNRYGNDIRVKKGSVFKSELSIDEINRTDKSIRLKGVDNLLIFDIVKKDFVKVFKPYCPPNIADKIVAVLSLQKGFINLTRKEENGEVVYYRDNGRKFNLCNIPEKYKKLVEHFDFTNSDYKEIADYLI